MVDYTGQDAQLGWETTPGTPATTTSVPSMGTVSIESEDEARTMQRQGALYPTHQIPTRRRSTWNLADAFPCRRHLVYWGAMLFGHPSVTQLATGVYRYTFEMSQDGAQAQTATIAWGDSEHARSVSYALAMALTMGWNIEAGDHDLGLSGTAGPMDHDATLAANPTEIEPSPILAENLRMFVAESLSAVQNAPAEVDNGYAVEVEIGDRWRGHGTFGSGAGYRKVVATKPSGTVNLQQLNDANSRAWSARYYDMTLAYLRLFEEAEVLVPETTEGAGDEIRESFEFITALRPEGDPAREDDEGAFVVTTSGLIVQAPDGFTPFMEIVTDVPPLAAWTV